MEILLLLLLSVPFFYVLGVAKLLSFFSSGKNGTGQNRSEEENLKIAIREIRESTRSEPNKSASKLIEELEEKLSKLKPSTLPTPVAKTLESSPKSPSVLQSDVGSLWSNWYDTNSINLLLYIGAFLIIASASIFVGFAWEEIPGTTKASLLSLLAILFFAFGIWFSRFPKIKSAGATFIGIGALLIPVCGSAWYSFVFKEAGVGLGPVWLTTSLIALCVYAGLTYLYKHSFFTYLSSITTLSFFLSLVNTFNLNRDFYVLASILSSLLLLVAFYLARNRKTIESVYVQPLEISANILMPLSLSSGLFLAIQDEKLFTLEAFTASLLGTVFYFLSYLMTRKPRDLAVGKIILPFSIVIFFNWLSLSETLLLYVLSSLGLFYLYLSALMQKNKLRIESDINLVLGLTIPIVVFLTSLSLKLDSMHIALLSLFPVVSGIAGAAIKKDIRIAGVSTLFLGIFAYTFHQDVLGLSQAPENLSIVYGLLGIVFGSCAVYLRNNQKYASFFVFSAVFFFGLGLLFGFSKPWYATTLCGVIAGFLAISAVITKRYDWLYASNAFIYLTALNLFRSTEIGISEYPLYVSGISLGIYLLHVALPLQFKKYYRNSALVGSLLNAVVFGTYGIEKTSTEPEIQRNGIISGYFTSLLFAIDSFSVKDIKLGIVASIIAMATYLLNLHYLGIDDILMYSIPLGVYFLVLSYITRVKKDPSTSQLLGYFGIFFLFIPTLFLSFGDDGGRYSIALGIQGILLIAAGISLSDKLYKRAGISGIVLAVLPQTYSYILLLPRWLAVGIVGIVFLVVAIYLLLRRNETASKKS